MASKQKELGLQNWLDIMTTNFFHFVNEGGSVQVKNANDEVIIILNKVSFKDGKLVDLTSTKPQNVV